MKGIIFGPVQSRRLGSSLGIDLTPYKTCNLDCVYCECGRTTNLTDKRACFYKVGDVLKEIDDAVNTKGHIDYITFSGSGEPTLYKDIKKLIKEIKKRYPNIKLAMITNSMLLTDKDVFDALLDADVVLPSVDSVLEKGFKKINRPHPDIDLKNVLESLKRFKKVFKGALWVEVFICPGINDTDDELAHLSKYLKELAPDKVQINTLDRPGSESWVKPLDAEGLKKVLRAFDGLPVDVVSRKLQNNDSYPSIGTKKDFDQILKTIKRRPLTLKDIISMTGYSEQKVIEWITEQIQKSILSEEKIGTDMFYRSK